MGILGHLEDCWGTPPKNVMKLKDGVAHLAWFVHQALGLITFAGAAGLLWRWRSQLSESHGDVGRMLWNMGIFLALACGYGSIPINTILGGWTSIYQLFWCSPGVQGFDPSPCGFPSLSFHSITFFLTRICEEPTCSHPESSFCPQGRGAGNGSFTWFDHPEVGIAG